MAEKQRLTQAQREYLRQKLLTGLRIDELEESRKRLARTCKHPDRVQEPWIYSGCAVGWKCRICHKHLATILSGPSSYRHVDEETAVLITYCKHPSFAVVDYTWEHDNGYGKQSMVTGERCMICRSEKHWKSSSNWMSHAEQERQAKLRRENSDGNY